MHSRTLYETESLELLRLNYHHANATFLDLSALLLLHYVRATAGSSTLTRPASLQAWLMFAWTTLRWTFVPVPCMPNTTDNSRSMGRSRCGGWFSQTRRQHWRKRGAVDYNNNNQVLSSDICSQLYWVSYFTDSLSGFYFVFQSSGYW